MALIQTIMADLVFDAYRLAHEEVLAEDIAQPPGSVERVTGCVRLALLREHVALRKLAVEKGLVVLADQVAGRADAKPVGWP